MKPNPLFIAPRTLANTLKSIFALTLVLTLSGCGESQATRREREAVHAQRLAQIEVEKAREMAEIKRKADADAAAAAAAVVAARRAEERKEMQRQIYAQQLAEANRLRNGKLKLVKELTFYTRDSLVIDNGKVLQIQNPNPQSIDVHLKCSTPRGYSKTIFVSVPAFQTTEIGFMEGWDFRRGETFEVISEDTVVHRGKI